MLDDSNTNNIIHLGQDTNFTTIAYQCSIEVEYQRNTKGRTWIIRPLLHC